MLPCVHSGEPPCGARESISQTYERMTEAHVESGRCERVSVMERKQEAPNLVPPAAESGPWSGTEQRVEVNYAMPVLLEARLRVADCHGAQGPRIRLQAALALSALEAQLALRIPHEDGRANEIERRITI